MKEGLRRKLSTFAQPFFSLISDRILKATDGIFGLLDGNIIEDGGILPHDLMK